MSESDDDFDDSDVPVLFDEGEGESDAFRGFLDSLPVLGFLCSSCDARVFVLSLPSAAFLLNKFPFWSYSSWRSGGCVPVSAVCHRSVSCSMMSIVVGSTYFSKNFCNSGRKCIFSCDISAGVMSLLR